LPQGNQQVRIMTDSTYDVIVAGAGPAGLAVALALSHAFTGELRVAVVDPAPRAGGGEDVRASALGTGSRRMLEVLGVWPRIADVALDVADVEITDSRLSDGIRPVLLTYEARLDSGEPAMSIVPNRDLNKALATTAGWARGVTLVPNVSVASVDRGGPTQLGPWATATLSDGRRLKARLIVAADGRRSPLRDAAGIRTIGWPHQQTGIVTMVRHDEPNRAAAVQHFLPGGPFAILPLTGNRACITWSEDADEAARLLAAPDADFLAALERRAGGRLGTLTLEGARGSWPLDTFLARSLMAERLALVGDAARGVHPIAGQGLNLGFRDAAALAQVIADAARAGQDIGSSAILEGYERWRRADGTMSAAGFDALNRLFSNDLGVLRTLRDAGLGLVDRMPSLKRRLIEEAAGLTGEVPRLLRGQSA
jgi:2-octaprenyl-6-methoxyphenol hydroxylase